MTNQNAPATATLVAPLSGIQLHRNKYGVIIDSFGDVSNARQCVTINATAHKTDGEGFVDQEIIRLTLSLNGPIRTAIVGYISLMLPPGYLLHDWCVWPGDENHDEPF